MHFDIQQSRLALLSSLMASVFLVAACGGGGGSGTPSEAAAEADARDEVSTEEAAAYSSKVKVADEGQTFYVKPGSNVQYGAGSHWTTKTLNGSGTSVTGQCTNKFFGVDPLYGTKKACYVDSTSNIAAAPAPASTPAVLSWAASTNSDVAGYRVYYGTSSRNYQQAKGSGVQASTTTYSVSGLAKGATYYFSVTSVDAAGNESTYSNEVSKVIQ